MASHPAFTKEDFERTHTIVCGGASSGAGLINSVLNKAGKYIFYQDCYGMTELTGGSHMLMPRHGNSRVNSIGKGLAHTETKVIDLETGASLGPNLSGEICVRGPNVS